MSSATKMPSAATSDYRLRRWGGIWLIQLQTPFLGKPTSWVFASSPNTEAAIQLGLAVKADTERPVRPPRRCA